MMFVNKILFQFYTWNLKYALSENHAARKAVYLFTTLASTGIFSIFFLFNFKIPVIGVSSVVFGISLTLLLYSSFVKSKAYKKGVGSKVSAILYVITIIFLFAASLFKAYLIGKGKID